MIIVGCDFHPSWQQVAVLDTESGEIVERKLTHQEGAAELFYRQLPSKKPLSKTKWRAC